MNAVAFLYIKQERFEVGVRRDVEYHDGVAVFVKHNVSVLVRQLLCRAVRIESVGVVISKVVYHSHNHGVARNSLSG